MQVSRLITYRFDPNVGNPDRVFRILSGVALAALPWIGLVSLPGWAAIAMTIFGIAWLLTGVLGRCGMYYLFGMSTRRD
ncbi:MAG: DUF2892 domain-containing protein [Pseudomonadota bacterium]